MTTMVTFRHKKSGKKATVPCTYDGFKNMLTCVYLGRSFNDPDVPTIGRNWRKAEQNDQR